MTVDKQEIARIESDAAAWLRLWELETAVAEMRKEETGTQRDQER